MLHDSRIVIVGGPRTGKTTLAKVYAAQLRCTLRHTDDVIDLGWSEASAEAATWLDYPGPFVLEGVAMARALRKWLAWGRRGKPCDKVVVLRIPKVETSEGQCRMAAGVDAVLAEITGALRSRGVEIEE